MIHCCCHIIYAWKIIFHGTLLENTSIKLSFAHVQKYLFAYSSNFFFTVGLTCAIIWLHKFGVSSNFLRNRVTSFLERRASSRTGGRSFELPSFYAAHLSLFHTSMIGKKNPSHTWLESYCRRFGHWKNKKDANYFSSNILTNCIFVLEKKRTLVLHFLCQI